MNETNVSRVVLFVLYQQYPRTHFAPVLQLCRFAREEIRQTV